MSLKPIGCIHAGDPGTHQICVCDQHQNIKLKLWALSRKLNYRDLLQAAVCNVDNEGCMSKKCQSCPGELGVKKMFGTLVNELNIEMKKGKIKYKNWVEKGSAAYLESFTADVENLKIEIYKDIVDITLHHFIADTQKRYLSYCKNNLANDTAIVLMDFPENYSFIIQQSVQTSYYNNNQATVHPICLYYKEEKGRELLNKNYCIISDSKDHYAYTVNAFTKKFMDELKQNYKWIKKVIYFTDGAPQQYKNKLVFSKLNKTAH